MNIKRLRPNLNRQLAIIVAVGQLHLPLAIEVNHPGPATVQRQNAALGRGEQVEPGDVDRAIWAAKGVDFGES